MKKILTVFSFLLIQIGVCNAQVANEKEDAFVKAFFEVLKKGDKKLLVEKFLLKESDLEVYNQSRAAVGSKVVLTKDEFAKLVEDRNSKITRGFEELRTSAAKAKVTFENTEFKSYKKFEDASAEVPAGYYKMMFILHEQYVFKVQFEASPLGDDFKLYNIMNTVSM